MSARPKSINSVKLAHNRRFLHTAVVQNIQGLILASRNAPDSSHGTGVAVGRESGLGGLLQIKSDKETEIRHFKIREAFMAQG